MEPPVFVLPTLVLAEGCAFKLLSRLGPNLLSTVIFWKKSPPLVHSAPPTNDIVPALHSPWFWQMPASHLPLIQVISCVPQLPQASVFVSPFVHSPELHSAAVLSHAPQLPRTHSPVAELQVIVRVCVPQVLQNWKEGGCIPLHSQESAIEQALHALQVPVVVSQVLVRLPPFLHPQACVEEPSQDFGVLSGTSPAEHSAPLV